MESLFRQITDFILIGLTTYILKSGSIIISHSHFCTQPLQEHREILSNPHICFQHTTIFLYISHICNSCNRIHLKKRITPPIIIQRLHRKCSGRYFIKILEDGINIRIRSLIFPNNAI